MGNFNQKTYIRAWCEANPEKVRAINAAYYKRHKDKLDAKAAAWNKANPEKVKTNGKTYRKANPEKRNADAAKAHASKIQRIPAWANPEKINEWYEAAAFATEIFEIPIEVDHIVPLHGKHVSGLHVDYNMQLLTQEANRKKRNTFGEI